MTTPDWTAPAAETLGSAIGQAVVSASKFNRQHVIVASNHRGATGFDIYMAASWAKIQEIATQNGRRPGVAVLTVDPDGTLTVAPAFAPLTLPG
jgi:hypothetical protein